MINPIRNISEIEDTAYNYAVASTKDVAGLTWIIASQNAPKPPYPYGVISIESITEFGTSASKLGEEYSEDIQEFGYQMFRVGIAFTVFGDSAGDILLKLTTGHTLKSIYNILKNGGIGFERFEPSANITVRIEDRVVNTHRVVLSTYVVVEREQITPFIKSFEGIGFVKERDKIHLIRVEADSGN